MTGVLRVHECELDLSTVWYMMGGKKKKKNDQKIQKVWKLSPKFAIPEFVKGKFFWKT